MNLSDVEQAATIDAPQDITVTYDNSPKWITDLTASEKPAWLDLDIYNNTAYMSVDSVKYTDNLGSAETTVTTSDIKAAGTYKVTMKLASGLKWTGESASGGDKIFSITINKKKSEPKPKVDPPITTPPFVSAGLPKLIADAGSTEGTFAWDTGEVATAGTKEYNWTFTPAEPNNFTVEKGKMELQFLAREMNGIAVTAYNPAAPVYTNTSLDTIKSYFTVEASYTDGNTEPLTTFKLEVDATDGKLKAGNNTLVITSNDDSQTITYEITEVIDVAVDTINLVQMSNNTFTYPVTADEIKAAISRVNVKWNTGSSGNLESLDDVTVTGTFNAGSSVTVTIGVSGTTATKDITIVINKGTYEMSGITFDGLTLTYDGSAHKIEISGTLPEGVSVVYSVAGETATEFTNAGTYEYTASFTHSNPNYNDITITKTATLKIEQATVTGIVFNNVVKPEITGTTYTAADIAATGVPDWVTVEYLYNGEEFTGASAAGTYTITAKFTHDDPNYEKIADKTATLTISDKPSVEGADDIVVEPAISAVYNGSAIDYSAKNVPDGVTVTYEILKDGVAFEGTEITEAGVYTVMVKFEVGADKMPIADKICVVTIEKADYDMSGVTFEDKTVTYNGENHTLTVTGDIPEGVSVEYYYNGAAFTGAADIGEYEIIAKFTHANTNYNDIADMTAKLTISDAVVSGISVVVEDGAKFDVNNTLDDLKAKLSAEIEYNNGTKEAVAVDNLTVTCDTLREGGKFDVGTQTITIKYTDENGTEHTTTVTVTVAKAKVALPVYKGTLSYTGDTNNPLKPTAADFEGFDGSIISLSDKTQGGVNAGAYKAVFALKDGERYEWATTTTANKKLFAVAVYDGETTVTLEANEAAVEWNIAKAVVTATRSEGAMPVFASESYKGSFEGVFSYEYFTDKECQNKVDGDKLAADSTYYVRAKLEDTSNFVLDETAIEMTTEAFEYATPQTLWGKIVKFLTSKQMGLVVWAWIVIAVVALILLITIIACVARSKKKKRIREERRLAEEKAERERKEEREREEREERRREEREERMARMSQQQAMPQMMMPQMMPQMQMPQSQYAPQSQPMAMGGNATDSAQMSRIENELAAIKAEQSASKELAAVRAAYAEKMMNNAKWEDAFTSLMAKLNGEPLIQGNLSMDKLTELVEKTVEKVLDKREKPAQPAQLTDGATPATPVATQVPPDAVMTTVTTTKIDTTKKSAQGAQGNAQTTRTTRSFVPPMPVDDGRVFDVGGFYKPADPMDLEDGEEDKK